MINKGLQFYSFEISTEAIERPTYLELRDGCRRIALPVRQGQTQHLYGNVVVLERPSIFFDHNFEPTEHSLGADTFMHPDQESLNKYLKSENTITYKVECRGTPRRAVITFPQHRGFGGWLAPYSIFLGEKLALDDCLYISFQEPYLTSGTYFLVDNDGGDPVPEALKIIRRELDKYSLSDESVTLIGSSKGANIAAIVSQHLTGNQLILCNYSTELDYRLRNNFLSYLAQTLDLLDVEIPDTLEILATESEMKETHWFYTIGDDLANRGHETLTKPCLTTYACNDRHGEILRAHWEFIKSLIDSRLDTL